jgi:hypothetical protein
VKARSATNLVFLLFCLVVSPRVLATTPYLVGDRVPARDLAEAMLIVETRLASQHFRPIGRYLPPAIPSHGTVIVTDKRLLATIRDLGGAAIVGAGIRVGVRADGAVYYTNPDYWYRAYFRRRYDSVQPAVKDVAARLKRALGGGAALGADVSALDLADYRYMIGMERFDSRKNELNTFASFEAAVRTIRTNLARGVGKTAEVYEVVMADRQIAVFGVAMNDPAKGDGMWVPKLGVDHIAALPYEIYVVGNKANALYGRYRIALSWPGLGMGTFIGVREVPWLIRETLAAVAGAKLE